jgi:hypothetical protein
MATVAPRFQDVEREAVRREIGRAGDLAECPERSGSYLVLSGSSPITIPSPASKAHQNSGSFGPPALPGLNAPMTLSDSRRGRRLKRR